MVELLHQDARTVATTVPVLSTVTQSGVAVTGKPGRSAPTIWGS